MEAFAQGDLPPHRRLRREIKDQDQDQDQGHEEFSAERTVNGGPVDLLNALATQNGLSKLDLSARLGLGYLDAKPLAEAIKALPLVELRLCVANCRLGPGAQEVAEAVAAATSGQLKCASSVVFGAHYDEGGSVIRTAGVASLKLKSLHISRLRFMIGRPRAALKLLQPGAIEVAFAANTRTAAAAEKLFEEVGDELRGAGPVPTVALECAYAPAGRAAAACAKLIERLEGVRELVVDLRGTRILPADASALAKAVGSATLAEVDVDLTNAKFGAEAAGTLAAAFGKQRTARLQLSVGGLGAEVDVSEHNPGHNPETPDPPNFRRLVLGCIEAKHCK